MAWRGALIKCTRTELHSSSILFGRSSRFPLHPQQRCNFRKVPKNTKKVPDRDAGKGNVVPPPPGSPHLPSRRVGQLLRPLVFTVGTIRGLGPGSPLCLLHDLWDGAVVPHTHYQTFIWRNHMNSSALTHTGCSFGLAAIMQYEAVKFRMKTAALEEDKEEKLIKLQGHDAMYWHNWWNQLSDFQKRVILLMSIVDDWWKGLSEGQKMVTGIIILNSAVLCCWRIPYMHRFMIKYFTSDPSSKTRCLPMILSSFSHSSVFHMMANMFVLWTFSSSVASLLGTEQFLAIYMSGGVFATFISYICKTATGRLGPSLGASGAVMTVLAAVCTKMPEAKLSIILLPVLSCTAGSALKALVALDTAGLLLGFRVLDHASHLGGVLFGMSYVSFGHDLIWRSMKPLVKFWHELRKGWARPGGGSQT